MVKEKKNFIEFRLLFENMLKVLIYVFIFLVGGGGRGSYVGCIFYIYDLDLIMINCVVLFD